MGVLHRVGLIRGLEQRYVVDGVPKAHHPVRPQMGLEPFQPVGLGGPVGHDLQPVLAAVDLPLKGDAPGIQGEQRLMRALQIRLLPDEGKVKGVPRVQLGLIRHRAQPRVPGAAGQVVGNPGMRRALDIAYPLFALHKPVNQGT